MACMCARIVSLSAAYSMKAACSIEVQRHQEKDSQRFDVDGRTKPRAVVGKDAGAFVMMSRLPIRVRDRLMRSALGLNEALKPAN